MKLILTYICCGIGLLSTCFGEETNRGTLTIQNNTAFTLVFPRKNIIVYEDKGQSLWCTRSLLLNKNAIEADDKYVFEFDRSCKSNPREINYAFYVQFKGFGAPDDEFLVEVNYPQGDSYRWVDLFEDEDEDKNYRETLRIVWEDEIIDGKPGVVFYQRARRIRGGTEPNIFVQDLREANKLDIE